MVQQNVNSASRGKLLLQTSLVPALRALLVGMTTTALLKLRALSAQLAGP